MNFRDFLAKFDWKEIRDCPGRFMLRDRRNGSAITKLITSLGSVEFQTEKAPDPVLVTKLKDGGLISYKKEASLVHTLCDSEGFARKLADLDISTD